MATLTHAGIGTVRTRLCLPTRSTMHHRPSRCWMWLIVSAATSDRRKAQPRSTAMMARSRRPLVVVMSGAFRSACACFNDSQFPARTPMDLALFTRWMPAASSADSRPYLGTAATASAGPYGPRSHGDLAGTCSKVDRGMHAFSQRLLAEELVRVRRPDDRERYAAAQRQARIDPNPHQIDAVIFALRRLREGGCILADEVGLGKTIEAGMVIAQSRSEGAQRILLIVPKSLIGQWQGELLNLFGIQARENDASFFAPGVYLVGREFAGSERGATHLGAVPPFDLAVIDEAHEIFAGLHKRYGRDGIYDESSDEALMAHRVRGFLRSTPVLLLTATPMQNSLAELWGLVQYVEPTGTLLGDIATFRKVFCDEDDRTLVPGQEHELQRRLAVVLQRTLRRQAQEFLDRPFTQRRCRLYEYAMSDAERSLYDDVTEYLLEPSLYAFSGRQRRLLLIQ